jgi:hypothetical protein
VNVRRAGVIGVLVASLGPIPLVAQEPPQATVPPRFSFRADAQWIGAAVLVHPSATWLNPGNQTLGMPQTTWLAELRANARLQAGSRFQLIIRPRVSGSIETTRADSMATENKKDATIEVTEAYLNWRPNDAISIAYGLQNFQWGPAEMMGPSNRLFHEVGVFRDQLYSVRGKHLIRVNVSAGRQWSLVAMAELGATDEAPFRAGAAFRRAAQAKLEYSTPSGGSYVGVTAGARVGEPPWMGGYAAVTLTDSLSAYLDASVQRGSQAWYPRATGDGAAGFANDARSDGMRALALTGVRYSFSATFDARLEYLRQDAGYTRAQVTTAAPLAVAQRPSPETVERWLTPGLEFLGRDLVMVSVLARDLAPAGRLDLHGRYVRSLTDGSGAGFLTASLDTTGALVLFGSLTLTHGPDLAEFTRLARAGGVVGLVWSW